MFRKAFITTIVETKIRSFLSTRMGVTVTIFLLLLLIFIGMLVDIVTDFTRGLSLLHLVLEGLVVSCAGMGMALLLFHYFRVSSSLRQSQVLLSQTQTENQMWRQESEKYIAHLSQILDRQFKEWRLSDSEMEVAHLLLKGYSVKVMAQKRFVVEKTIRTQLSAIYSKSGLSTRQEFVSFFLPLFYT